MISRAAARLAAWRPAQVLARVGFAAKALLYADIGWFAVHRAFVQHGPVLDVKGALERLARTPAGPALPAVAGAAIACLGLWFVVEALTGGPAPRGGWWGAVSRLGQAVGGGGYVLLGLVGVRELLGLAAGPSGDQLARSSVAQALVIPGGPAVGAVLGAIGVGVGIRQAVQGLSHSFVRSLDLSTSSQPFRRVAVALGTAGFTAQGAVFGAAGALILRAIVHRDPAQAAGTHGVLRVLAQLPGGDPVLSAVGAGLLAYAGYALVEARARRFPGPQRVSWPSAGRRPSARTPADRTAG